MKPGTIQLGPASAHIGYSGIVPPHLRGKLREVSSLVVDQASRGKGFASALMREVIDQADQTAVALLVVVEPFDDGPLAAENLRFWYARMGFTEIQAMPCVMVRTPQQKLND